MYDDDNLYEPARLEEETPMSFELHSHFVTLEKLLQNRRETLANMNRQYIKATGDERKYLNDIFERTCADYSKLIVGEAQRVVDTHNPDGSLKE